jgi:hypothetical protein
MRKKGGENMTRDQIIEVLLADKVTFTITCDLNPDGAPMELKLTPSRATEFVAHLETVAGHMMTDLRETAKATGISL